MSSLFKKSNVGDEEDNRIECTPDAIVASCGGCAVCFISFTAVAAMCVIAGGSFWAAQALEKLTDGTTHIQLVRCCSDAQCILQTGAAACPSAF